MKNLDLKEFGSLYGSCELNRGIKNEYELQAFANGMLAILDNPNISDADVIKFYKSLGF